MKLVLINVDSNTISLRILPKNEYHLYTMNQIVFLESKVQMPMVGLPVRQCLMERSLGNE